MISGDMIVVDSENSRLQIFSHDGKFIRVIGQKGSKPHELNHPMGVSLMKDSAEFENLLVTDSVNASVKVGIIFDSLPNGFGWKRKIDLALPSVKVHQLAILFPTEAENAESSMDMEGPLHHNIYL